MEVKITATPKEVAELAKELRNQYAREYRAKNAERIRDYNREWHKNHPGKANEYYKRHWEKKALELLRAAEEI